MHPSPHQPFRSGLLPRLAWGSLAILACCGAVALWQSRHAPGYDPHGTGSRLLPTFAPDHVDRLEFRRTGETLALVKQDGRWLISSRWNYPADPEQVRGFLGRLDEAVVIQKIPVSSPQHLDALQLAEVAPGNAHAGLEVEGSASGASLFRLVLGLPHWNETLASRTEAMKGAVDARYVQVPAPRKKRPDAPEALPGKPQFATPQVPRPDAPETIPGKPHNAAPQVPRPDAPETIPGKPHNAAPQVPQVLGLSSDPFDSDFLDPALWMNHGLWELGGLKSVRLVRNGQPVWTLSKTRQEDHYSLAPLDPGESLSPEGLRKFYALLAQTAFDDVADPKLAPAETGLESPAAVCELEDFQGRRLTFSFGKATAAGVFTKISCQGGLAPGVAPELLDRWVYLFSPDLVKGLTCPRSALVDER